jgi:hypothetical protein
MLELPTRTNRAGFMINEIGPCYDLHAVAYKRLRANSSSSATAECSNHGPMRETRFVAILPAEVHAGPRDSLVRQPFSIRAYCCVHEMGPCKSLHAVAYRQPRADSNSSATAEGLHHRPM